MYIYIYTICVCMYTCTHMYMELLIDEVLACLIPEHDTKNMLFFKQQKTVRQKMPTR